MNQQLTPMETVLLASLSDSQAAHEQRLVALEQLLNQLSSQSKTDSDSAINAVSALNNRLSALEKQLNALSPQLNSLAQQLTTQLNTRKDNDAEFAEMKKTFRTQAAQYENLASELYKFRALCTQLSF